MGKKGKGKGSDLGRALLKDRFGASRSKHRSKDPSMVRLCIPCVFFPFFFPFSFS